MRCRWTSLFSYAYMNEMTFAPLQTSTHDGDPVACAKVQGSCSPRSMYSLAASVSISYGFIVPNLDKPESWGSKTSRSPR